MVKTRSTVLVRIYYIGSEWPRRRKRSVERAAASRARIFVNIIYIFKILCLNSRSSSVVKRLPQRPIAKRTTQAIARHAKLRCFVKLPIYCTHRHHTTRALNDDSSTPLPLPPHTHVA